ncbi:MAG: hypothetical protein ACRDRL_06005, partial [Sciscionella sp.]
HQLTPFVLAGLLLIMVLSGRLWPAWLPWTVLLAALVWFSLGAQDFWSGQLNTIISGVGSVGSTVNQGIGARFVGDAGRTVILLVRVGLTCAVGALAGAGWLLLRRHGVRSWTLPLLAVAPFGLIVLQSYGGEVFLRCYLFSLPFSAILAAGAVDALIARGSDGNQVPIGTRLAALAPSVQRRSLMLTLTVLVLSGLGIATVTARGGNDAYTSFSRADLAAVDYVYRTARGGQTLEALTSAVPLEFRRVGDLTQGSLDTECTDYARLVGCVLHKSPDYLIVTPSEANDGRIYYGRPAGWTRTLLRQLVASGGYRVAFRQGGTTVLATTKPTAAAGKSGGGNG